MGRVKLAKHNATDEKCAVKIVPRAAKLYRRAHDNEPIKSPEHALQRHKEFEKEIARDKRTIREGALGRLLFHPHICRLYEMVTMSNHFYMLFEYVEGGQLLDYIVSHGSLNENFARKFARGIALALDYCHKNNVVHRDLKIENIMINQKGEIKIIDFGLSNLYTQNHLLKTYCGSLYFAAPELLSAKPYTGPEVDVWSFGVVLYVLVCGKVPFDDPVVSALHEKIKKGNVEYPSFISKDCVSLLSRMLVVDPSKRATLSEVMQHPWMNIGHDYPVPSYAPKRVPLTLPLDPQIIQAISSFDLGAVSTLTEELTIIISSPDYQLASDNWYKAAKQGRLLQHGAPDPVFGYHPLVSIYYLVDEMRKRKRAKEEAFKSQMRQQAELDANASKPPIIRPPVPKQRTTSLQGSPSPNVVPYVSPAATLEAVLPPPQKPQPVIRVPEQAHTPGAAADSVPIVYDEYTLPQRAQKGAYSATLDPNAGRGQGFNSLLRKMSARKPGSVSPDLLPTKVKEVPARKEGLLSPDVESSHSLAPSNADPLMRRGVSMKVTAKEKSASKSQLPEAEANKPQIKPMRKEPGPRTHNRSHSTTGKSHGFIPVEYLPPLPNIMNSQGGSEAPQVPSKPSGDGKDVPVSNRFHPTARAKSVGSHARKDSSYYRGNKQPALPNSMAAQNSDDGIDHRSQGNVATFDDIVLDEAECRHVPSLSEDQIIEQFNHSRKNSMPSIEYPKTLFLKGFFSVQTTSTKPLPVIRYNILRVLSNLGVKFQEVKGGFLCVHTNLVAKEKGEESPTASTIIDGYRLDGHSEEHNLYGDAFKTSTESIEKSRSPDSSQEPPQVPQLATPNQPRQLSRKGSINTNSSAASPTSARGHRHTSLTSLGHRRKFSIGQGFLQNYRKKNGSQTLAPPSTPAAAKINRILVGAQEAEDGELGEEALLRMNKLTYDDSFDSLNGDTMAGGSDMLVSSRIEHRNVQRRPLGGNEDAASQPTKKTPLKFEINIVKVPLVGLYGVQFKKTLGNTWNYKTLASHILEELNL